MKNQEDIRGLLKADFAGYEASPDRDLWPDIADQIRPARRKALWWGYAAAAAIALLLLTILWLSPITEPTAPQHLSETQPTQLLEDVTSAPENPSEMPRAPVAPALASQPEANNRPGTPNHAQVQTVAYSTPEAQSPAPETQATPLAESRVLAPMARQHPPQMQELNEPVVAMQVPVTRPVGNWMEAQEEDDASLARLESSPHNRLSLDQLNVKTAVNFLSEEISKLPNSPVEVKREVNEKEERRTFQLKLFDLKITRKSHKRSVKSI